MPRTPESEKGLEEYRREVQRILAAIHASAGERVVVPTRDPALWRVVYKDAYIGSLRQEKGGWLPLGVFLISRCYNPSGTLPPDTFATQNEALDAMCAAYDDRQRQVAIEQDLNGTARHYHILWGTEDDIHPEQDYDMVSWLTRVNSVGGVHMNDKGATHGRH